MPELLAAFNSSLAAYVHGCFANSTLADELFKASNGSGFQLLIAIEDHRITEELHGQSESVIWNQAKDKLTGTKFDRVPDGQLLDTNSPT